VYPSACIFFSDTRRPLSRNTKSAEGQQFIKSIICLVKIEQYLDNYDDTMSESPRRLFRVSRWATLPAWNAILDRHFRPYGLAYDSCICIHAQRKNYDYIAYFTLKHHESVKNPLYKPPYWLRFACIHVSFDMRGYLHVMDIGMLGDPHVYIIQRLRPEMLILDRRREYSWVGYL